MKETGIKLAVPNKGRLREPTLTLLKKAGFTFRAKDRALYAHCTNSDLTLIFLRADDIPVLVEKGVVHLGITGEDLVEERSADLAKMLELDFGRCRLCIAAQADIPPKSLKDFDGKTIATSFPVITGNYFATHAVSTHCIEMKGSVEIMVKLGLADAIVDVVETGDTLRENNLEVFNEIGKYQTSLFANHDHKNDPRIKQIVRRLEGIIIANRYSMLEYNITRTQLQQAEQITPGFESPTIAELEDKDWLAVKVMVERKSIPAIMDQLESLGATAIFETEIKNCRIGS